MGAGHTVSWTQPICERDWFTLYPGKLPPRIMRGGLKQCCICGGETIAGIYIRRDPATVTYPQGDDD